jgi:hypothetical protein
MEDLIQKASEDFAANWGHDFYCNCEHRIKSAGRVVSLSESSGESIVRIETDVWVLRDDDNRKTIAHYIETHEIEENELLNDTGPDHSTAFVPSDVIDLSYDEFDLMSTDSKALAKVPAQILNEAARLLADALEDNGFEDFFQGKREWEYELPLLHPTIRRELKKRCREQSKKIKAEVQKLERARK